MTSDSDLFIFFAYLKNGEIRRVLMNRELQKELTDLFNFKVSEFIPSEEDKILKFEEHPCYKPERDEIFVIEGFDIPTVIIDALRNRVAYRNLTEDEYDDIKAIFCGKYDSKENCVIVFTIFDARNIIQCKQGRYLIYKSETFTKFNKKLLIINSKIDLLFINGNLYFRSLHNAKKVFKDIMNEYYREATDQEVEEFSKEFFGEDVEIPEDFLDSRARKLIFGVVKSEMNFDLEKVVEIGRNKFRLNLEINDNGKLELPDDKREFKKFLKLLNDYLYESPLTGLKYETNSKKRLS